MNRILKRFLPCLLVVISLLTLISCNKYKYPKQVPTISNPDSAYLTIGDYKVTNKSAYYRLLNTYGLSLLLEQIDSELLKDQAYDQAKFEEQMNVYIYGTKDPSELEQEEKDELYKTFTDTMYSQGLVDKDAWTAYYLLEYKRLMFAIEDFKKYVEKFDKDAVEKDTEVYFTEKEYQDYYEANYHKDQDLIIITFDSELQAKNVMNKAGINTKKLSGAWENNSGNTMTDEDIKNAFIKMYKEVYNEDITGSKTYEYSDITKISSTIASRVGSLEVSGTKSYTHGPLVYGSRYYLVLKTGESELADYEKITDEVKKEIFEAMVEDACSSTYISKALMEARNEIGLKIFDEGIEKLYVSAYEKNYSTLSITDYKKFVTTDETSDKVFASYKIGDKQIELSVDKMFEYMNNRYGVMVSLLLLQQYVILNNRDYNNVYDFVNNRVLDKTKYNKYYKADITEYKKAFLDGEYASSGYPKSYGWNNFLTDYLGVTNELDLLINLDSNLYKEAEGLYKKAMYMGEEETTKDEEGNTVVVKTKDQLVQDEMERIFKEFFSASVIGVYAFYDTDLNGIADDLESESDAAKLAQELTNKVYTEAKAYKKDFDTLAARLSFVVKQYNLADRYNTTWGQYKAKGLRLSVLSSTTYTNTSTADETILDNVRVIWNEILAYKNTETGADITGQSLDPGYRYSKSSVVYYVTAEDFADNKSSFVANNSAYRVAVTKATNHTYISSSAGTYKPTLAEYENYLKDDDDDSKTTVSSAMKTAITTYYEKAISNLTADKLVNDKLMKECLDTLANVTWRSDINDLFKERAAVIIKLNMSDESEEGTK